MNKPILLLIGGAPRSGTSLMLRLLDWHPRVLSFPREIPVIEHFLAMSGESSVDAFFRSAFVSDLTGKQAMFFDETARVREIDRLRKHLDLDVPFALDVIAFKRRYLSHLGHAPGLSLRDIFFALGEALIDSVPGAAQKYSASTEYFCLKTPLVTEQNAVRLADQLPGVKFIHLVRDPISRYVSARAIKDRLDGGLPEIESFVRSEIECWINSIILSQSNREMLGDDRYRVVAYENLVRNPREVMTSLATWLEIEPLESLFIPSFLGSPIRANSSFSSKTYSVDMSNIDRNADFRELCGTVEQKLVCRRLLRAPAALARYREIVADPAADARLAFNIGIGANVGDFPILGRFVAAFQGPDPPEVLVFGDSVAQRVADDDTDCANVEEIYQRLGGERRNFFFVSQSAFHAEVFSQFCRVIERLEHAPRAVVIPINLRSFSPSWDLHPDYQFLYETAVLDDIASRRLIERSPFENSPVARAVYQAVPFEYAEGGASTIGDFISLIGDTSPSPSTPAWTKRLRAIFTFHYMTRIAQEHRKLRHLRSIAKQLARLRIPALFYITPINHDAGTRLLGTSFSVRRQENVNTLRNGLQLVGAKLIEQDQKTLPGFFKDRGKTIVNNNMMMLVDYSSLFPARSFFTEYNATEHLRFPARQLLVKHVLDLVEDLLRMNCQN